MPKKYLLLIIDAQKGIDKSEHWGGNRNNPDAEKNIELLLNHFRKLEWPVIHVQHCSDDPQSPLRPGQTGHEFKEANKPEAGEPIIQKSTPNAFIKTDLQEKIIAYGVDEVVVVGFVTNNSVEATARMSGNLGFKTIVLSDATATFDKKGIDGETFNSELVHSVSLANLNEEYALILSTQQFLNRMKK